MSGSHNHSITKITKGSLSRALTIGIILNLLFVVVEFGAGWYYGSVSLMSDAGHNLSDVVSLALALIAFRLAEVKPTEKYTYGFKKSTVIVSLVNACILLIALGIIAYESVSKLINPHPIEGLAIAWVAGVGVLINGFTVLLLVRHKSKDLNAKGAYLHMIADMLISVGVVVAGIVIYYTGWYVIDPILGIVIAIVIFMATWGLLRDSVRLSVDGAPIGINITKVIADVMASDDRIVDIHHPHVWALSTTENALTAHVVLKSMEDMEQVKSKIKHELDLHGISHVTLEFELENSMPLECRELHKELFN